MTSQENVKKKEKKEKISRTQRVLETLMFGGLVASLVSDKVGGPLGNVLLISGFVAMAVSMILVGMLKPGKDTYCCSNCGHSHIPEGNFLFRRKTRFYCPECNKRTEHSML